MCGDRSERNQAAHDAYTGSLQRMSPCFSQSAADMALEQIPARTVVSGRRVVLKYSYADTGAVTRLVEASGARISSFGTLVAVGSSACTSVSLSRISDQTTSVWLASTRS